MKRIIRMLVFSAIALFVTSIWNKGFLIPMDIFLYIKASILISIVFYILVPISKLVLLPLNILTLGLASVAAFTLLLHLISKYFTLISIKAWHFAGISLAGITVPALDINYLFNLFISALSIATIINLSERII